MPVAASIESISLDPVVGGATLFTGSGIGQGNLTYAWSFGDGNNEKGANPTHIYSASGKYTITLTVTDSAGITSNEVSATITVNDPPAPSALTITPNKVTIAINAPLSLTGTASGANPLTYSWDFGDGTPLVMGSSTLHTYTSTGSYTVTMTVTDPLRQTSQASASITVHDPSIVSTDGIGKAIFPDDYLDKDNTAIIMAKTTPEIDSAAIFDIVEPLVLAINDIHIQFTNQPSSSSSFDVSFVMPPELQSAINNGGEPTILVANHYVSDDEESGEDLISFETAGSVTYNAATKTVSGKISSTSVDTIFGKIPEVVIKLAVRPAGTTSDTATTVGINRVASAMSSTAPNFDPPLMLYPLAQAPVIVAPYGEAGHTNGAHPSIDLRTLNSKGETSVGIPVRAVADGWVSAVQLKGCNPNVWPTPGYCTKGEKNSEHTFRIVQTLDGGKGIVKYLHLQFGSFALKENGVTIPIAEQAWLVNNDQKKYHVKAGDIIAMSGDTGAAGKPHLHLEYYLPKGGQGAVNPIFILGKLKLTLPGDEMLDVNSSAPLLVTLGTDIAEPSVQAQLYTSENKPILVVRKSKANQKANLEIGCLANEVCLPVTAQDKGNPASFEKVPRILNHPVFDFNLTNVYGDWSELGGAGWLSIYGRRALIDAHVDTALCPTVVMAIETDCGFFSIIGKSDNIPNELLSATYTLKAKNRPEDTVIMQQSAVVSVDPSLYIFPNNFVFTISTAKQQLGITNSDGVPVFSGQWTWRSLDGNVVKVDSLTGMAIPVGNGLTTITATDSKSGRVISTQVGVQLPTPSIDSIAPEKGIPGETVVRIRGTRLLNGVADPVIRFSGVLAKIIKVNQNSIDVLVPEGAETGSISLSTPEGSATFSGFEVIATGKFEGLTFSPSLDGVAFHKDIVPSVQSCGDASPEDCNVYGFYNRPVKGLFYSYPVNTKLYGQNRIYVINRWIGAPYPATYQYLLIDFDSNADLDRSPPMLSLLGRLDCKLFDDVEFSGSQCKSLGIDFDSKSGRLKFSGVTVGISQTVIAGDELITSEIYKVVVNGELSFTPYSLL